MKTIAVIPCYDEGQFIYDVVCGIKQYVDDVVVSDDSSIDNTVSEAEKAGAYVVRRNTVRGYGHNKKAGMKEALKRNAEIVITLDGDAQHKPDDVKKLIEIIENGEADIVVGSRFLSKNTTPFYRVVGIKIITFIYNVFSRYKLSDAQCCFRAYRKEVLNNIEANEGGFTFSTELLIKARSKGYRIREVPVTVYYHNNLSHNSTLNPFIHGLGVAFGTLKVRLKVELMRRNK